MNSKNGSRIEQDNDGALYRTINVKTGNRVEQDNERLVFDRSLNIKCGSRIEQDNKRFCLIEAFTKRMVIG